MSDETTPSVTTATSPSSEAAAGPVPVPEVAAAPVQFPAGGGHGVRPVIWVAAVASALALALVLSGVSFGAGVLVGTHGARFGPAPGASFAQRGAVAQDDVFSGRRMPGPGFRDGGRPVPGGRDDGPPEMPGGGRGMRGGGQFGSPGDTASAPPAD